MVVEHKYIPVIRLKVINEYSDNYGNWYHCKVIKKYIPPMVQVRYSKYKIFTENTYDILQENAEIILQ